MSLHKQNLLYNPCVCVLVALTCLTLCNPHSLSMEFSRQEYWSRLPCPSPGDLLDPGMEPTSPACPALQVAFLPLSHWEGPKLNIHLPYDQSDNCTLASTLVSTLEKGNLLFTSKPLQDVSSSSIPDCQTLETTQISFKR